MVTKRALVVDDSKSARAFLARLLEEQQVEVDSAETAEQALEYLRDHRPDVIFMDHLMPGMDGFQAVQAIKGNPRTAAIPILMYTSQEGELYLGQARALGAVGVVPKSVSAADVRLVLQQLHFSDQPAPQPTTSLADNAFEIPTIEVPVASGAAEPVGPAVDEMLKEEVAGLRRHVSEVLDAQGQHVVRSLVTEMRDLIRDSSPPPLQVTPDVPRHSPVPWFLVAVASVAAAVLGTLWWQERQQLESARKELMDSRSTVALLTARLTPAPTPADMVVVSVPAGEPPLSGARIDALKDFVARLAARGQKGAVEVRYAAMPAAGVAPEGGTSLVEAAPESEAFSAAVAELGKQHAQWLTIDVVPVPRQISVQNAAGGGEQAAQDSRVEMRWHPAQ